MISIFFFKCKITYRLTGDFEIQINYVWEFKKTLKKYLLYMSRNYLDEDSQWAEPLQKLLLIQVDQNNMCCLCVVFLIFPL